MEPSDPLAPKGRARGRARGQARPLQAPLSSQGEVQRISPPGRPLEPRMGELCILEASPVAVAEDNVTRYMSGNGNGNGNGGNGNNGNGNGNGSKRSEQLVARPSHRNTDRYDFVSSRPEKAPEKTGTLGVQMDYFVNYFKVKTGQEWKIFQYRVDFEPAVDETRQRRMLLRPFRCPPEEGGFGMSIFDGHSLWTVNRLTKDRDDPPITRVSTLEKDNSQYTIKVKMVDELTPNDPQYLHFYNNITRTCLRLLNLCQMGRNYFDPAAEITLPNYRLKLWPGFVTTLRQHDAGLLYCVELTNKVIRMDDVFTVMMRIRGEAQGRNQDFKEAILKEIAGTIVLTMYNNKTYRVDDINWQENPESTFTLKDGSLTTFRDYYQRYSSHRITNMKQPLLVSNPKARDIRMGRTEPYKLIPELCQMTGLTDQMRQNYAMMKEMGQYLFQVPQKKMESTVQFMRRLLENTSVVAELSGWGLEISRAPLSVIGRKLPNETVTFRDTRSGPQASGTGLHNFPVDDKADFTMGLRGAGYMLTTVALNTWCVIASARDAQQGLDNLVSTMNKVARPLGFQISNPTEIIQLNVTNPDAYNNALTTVHNKHRNLQMVFVILSNNRLDTYSAVKKKCYLDYAIPSQCILTKTMNNRGLMAIATKIVIQMNAKLGGQCWGCAIPLTSTMIVGFDVHHGGSAGTKAASIGAMVATTSANFCSYYSTVSFANSREEISTNMASDIAKCVKSWRNLNSGKLPDRIFFYRDGVGEGQLSYVYHTELEAIKGRLQEMYSETGKNDPMFTMIICTKRINTRIFLKTGNTKCDNPSPGSILDSGVTLPERWDFFLVAQASRQGTVSPTNYNIIFDQNSLDSNRMQRLTYKLCHMYYNWSGGVAVPAVVQYAHKLAFLTGTALGRAGNENLSCLLYYL